MIGDKQETFDSYMAGFCMWFTPRQILLAVAQLEKSCPEDPKDSEAYKRMLEQLQAEAAIKRKKYLGGA